LQFWLPTHPLFWAHDKPIIVLDKVIVKKKKNNTFFLELGKKIIRRVGKFEKKIKNYKQQQQQQ